MREIIWPVLFVGALFLLLFAAEPTAMPAFELAPQKRSACVVLMGATFLPCSTDRATRNASSRSI